MKTRIISVLLTICLLFTFVSCSFGNRIYIESVNDVPEFNGDDAYIEIRDNIPEFSKDDINSESFETYSELDSLGRCGVATACIGVDIMPTEERGEIGQVKPTGWHTIKYDVVDGKYLYNRCHLIGYQLTGENANKKNLITGTRYMNVDGMLPFENMVADYVKETKNHVMYRVTPVFDEDCLVARGVQIEALSVEDNGRGIKFNVYVYNNQPGVSINYYNGESLLGDGIKFQKPTVGASVCFILNRNSKKFHKDDCTHGINTSAANKEISYKTSEQLIKEGYTPCKVCKPEEK